MKKLFSILLSAVMIFSCVFAFPANTYANTKMTATEIGLYQSTNAGVDSVNPNYWIKFTPSYTGYFEFDCSAISYGGMVFAGIYDATDEVLMMNVCDNYSSNFITAAELTAGEDYYFVLETSGCSYYTSVTVRPHGHSYTVAQNYPASYDYNEPSYNDDGGNYTFCAYCDSYIENAVYYYPATFKLKKRTFTYDGKKKYTTVTVYDRAGNIINPSNYKVSYSNNCHPGYGTVRVTFNNVNYSGSYSTTITIKPKRQTITYIKSKSKKSLYVKWKKDTKASGYQVQYSTSKKFYKSKTKTVSVSKKYNRKTISKLKSKKKYYVRVRSYKTSKGKKIYGDWSKVKTVKVK